MGSESLCSKSMLATPCDDVALANLKTCALSPNLVIHDVPGDGNCMYWAVLYQLHAQGACCASVSELREMTADYLESHSDFYREFICESVPSSNPMNADTEPPSGEDAQINLLQDPYDRLQACWAKYLRGVRSTAWGDNFCIAALANLFSVTINVYTATEVCCTINTITPFEGSSLFDINIGLFMQYHYVALNEVSPQGIDVSQSTPHNHLPDLPEDLANGENDSVCSDNLCTDDLQIEDATFDKGDELSREVTGGPSASMMSIEDPEAFAEIVCLAPGEGQKPLSIFTDEHFESMSNPDKFPYGRGCFSDKRPCKLTYKKYFNQRLLNVDGRFASDVDYLFTAQYIVEAKQIQDDCNSFVFRQKSRNLTAGQAKDQAFVGQCLREDKAYRFMKNVRGSPPYYQRTFYEMLAMIRQLGTPTWFLTLSAADLKWPDIIQTVARQYGIAYTDEQVVALSFEEKSSWIRRNPVTAARHFQYRLNTFFNEFLKSSANPLGQIVDYTVRIEFQHRDGSRMLKRRGLK